MFELDIDIRGDLDIAKELTKEVRQISHLVSQRADIGIFESKSDRDDGKTNAEVGLAHEFGAPERNIPQRSFLRQPIIDGSFEAMLDEKEISINKNILSQLATLFLKAVKEEFKTNGRGFWANLSDKTRRKENKNRDQILRDTKQLYESVDKRVVNK